MAGLSRRCLRAALGDTVVLPRISSVFKDSGGGGERPDRPLLRGGLGVEGILLVSAVGMSMDGIGDGKDPSSKADF